MPKNKKTRLSLSLSLSLSSNSTVRPSPPKDARNFYCNIQRINMAVVKKNDSVQSLSHLREKFSAHRQKT